VPVEAGEAFDCADVACVKSARHKTPEIAGARKTQDLIDPRFPGFARVRFILIGLKEWERQAKTWPQRLGRTV
jgi:hypothetical protein